MNGGAVKRAASLAGSFPAVVFDPGHLSLVKGAPEGRRKFLDAALCQLYPGYLTMIQEAQNVVTYTINLMKVSRKFQAEKEEL